jgi:hypothetical protein
MIKLEDLKERDRIYGISPEGLGYVDSVIITTELRMFDDLNPIECVRCIGDYNIIMRASENYIFRNKQEAIDNLDIIKLKLGIELPSDALMNMLYKSAIAYKKSGKHKKYHIFKLAIKLHKGEGLI